MIAHPVLLADEAQAFADELDAINDRSVVDGPETPERISKILEAHEARCADLARAEAQHQSGSARQGRKRHS